MYYFTACCVGDNHWYDYVRIISKFDYHIAGMDWLEVRLTDNE